MIPHIDEPGEAPVSTVRRDGMMFGILAAGVFSFSLLQAVSVPTMPLLHERYGADAVTANWTLTAFLLAAAVSTPITGRLGDMFGRRRMFILSVATMCVGSLLAAMSPSIGVLIAARAVQGLGAGTLPLAFALIKSGFDESRAPAAISLVASLIASGFAVGIVLTGPVTEIWGIGGLFAFPAVIAAMAGVAAALALPESTTARVTSVPWGAALVMSGWMLALLLAVTKAPAWGWMSSSALILLTVAFVLAVCWLRMEWTARTPLIDLRLMASRRICTANLAAVSIGVATYGWFGFLPQFNQTPVAAGYGFGATITESGYLLLPAAIASFGCGMGAARIAAVVGNHRVVAAGSLLTAAGLVTIALAHDHRWQACVAATLCGLGSGLATACLANAVVAATPAHQTAVATGMNANLRTLGGAFGTAGMTSIVGAGTLSSGGPTVDVYIVGFLALAGVAIIGAAAAAFMTNGAST